MLEYQKSSAALGITTQLIDGRKCLAKTIHGRETREARTERSLASARLAILEAVGFSIGLMSGTRSRGAKSKQMAEAYPELETALQIQGLVTKPMRELIRQYLKNTRLKNM